MNKRALQSSLPYLDTWLRTRHDLSEMPGFVVAIALDGETIFNQAYGVADLESKTPLTPDYLFRVASHSKTFTAIAILQLVEAGKLRLDDYAVTILPWLGNHQDHRWQQVTIRQLLSHSAGVIRDGYQADYWQGIGTFPTEEQLKQIILEATLVFDTNVQMKYSNIGYGVLGLIIQTVSGAPYNQHVTDHIITPLGLAHTYPELPQIPQEPLPTGYSRKGIGKKRKPFPAIRTESLSPATGFCSTSIELLTFINALAVGSGKLLSDESKKEMQRTQWEVKNSSYSEEYGLGVTIDNEHGHRMIGHSGGFPGYHSRTMIDPTDKLSLTVLVNCIDSDIDSLVSGTVSFLDHFEESDLRQNKQDWTKFAGRYMDAWTITDLVPAGNKIVASYPGWSPLDSPEELEYVDETTLKVVKTTGYYSEGELVHFSFDSNGKVESINYCGSTMWPENVWQARESY